MVWRVYRDVVTIEFDVLSEIILRTKHREPANRLGVKSKSRFPTIQATFF